MQVKCVGLGNATGMEGLVYHATFQVIDGKPQDRIEVYSHKPITYEVGAVYSLTTTLGTYIPTSR